MKKRIMAMLLMVAMIVSLVPSNILKVFAASTSQPIVSVEDVWAASGSTVEVNVTISGNPGIYGATLTISWAEGLELVDAESGDVFNGLAYQEPSRYVSSGTNFIWYGTRLREIQDGTVLKLTFEVAENVEESAVLAINVTGDALTDIEDNTVSANYEGGSVRIVNYSPGDTDKNDTIDTRDLIALAQYISDNCTTDPDGFNVTINVSAADVNDDGKLDPKDLVLIAKYISDGCTTDPEGFNVILKPSTPKCAHEMQATAAKAATCTENGNDAYWYCAKCKKYFSNESGTAEIALAATVIEATGHNIVTIPGYAATKTETGLTDGKACDRYGCGLVEVEQEVIPVITGYAITYEIANGEDYIEKNSPIIPADKMQYFGDTSLELPQLKVAGYRFIGWSYSQASSDNIITEIPAGTMGDKQLFAHWAPIVYTVTFDTPDVSVNGTKITGETILNATEYTVDKGKDLPPAPKCPGYTFVGWSNDDGFIINRIKPGTTGHMTLHANWTSDRNKATSYQSYGDPIIIEDDANGQILFVYNIGRIDNVPLNEIPGSYFHNMDTKTFNEELTITDAVDEGFVNAINEMISNATTKSSGWTLSKEWNDIYSTQEEVGNLTEKSDERTTSEGTTVGGKYFVSNSQGGSTYVSTESGGSSSNSSKVTTENSVGINASYDHTTEKYCDAKLGASNVTEASAGVEIPVKIAKVSAGIKNTTTVEAEVKNGRKDTDAFHIDGSISKYVGTVDTNDSSSYYNSAVNNASNWNSTTSYEQSVETSRNEAVTQAIKEQLSQTTTHSVSQALGGENSKTSAIEDTSMSAEEYSTSLTYNKKTATTSTKTVTETFTTPGHYRYITAGTIHVYGVVGYDVATASYYTYCFNVLDDTTRQIWDYSKDNMNFNDCENGVVTFEIPYEINEYVAGFVGKTDGLKISYEGVVTGFTVTKDFNGTVVVPQYEAKDNKDGSFSAVKVTSFAASAFAGNEDIETVVLPIYITEIPDGAFAGCINLKTVIAYGVTKIGANAFSGCTSLNKFSVDSAITSIGENAFENVPEIAVTAYNAAVADAAIASGAKRVSVNIAYIKDAYENKVVKVDSNVEYFALIGNGGNYKNVQIESNADETMISNMVFVNNADNPIKLASGKVTLARVVVENSPAFALVLTADQVELDLLGTVSLNATVENTVLSKSVTLNTADQSTTSKMVVNGKYLVYGEVTNKSYLNVEPTVITEEQFESYLITSVVTFNANGGSVEQTSKIVYMDQQYGALPTPEKQYFAFKGWYTAAEGGTQITAETIVNTKVNQTLYAHWEAITAIIQFNANGGSISESSKLVYIGEKVGSLPTPSRTHYSFKGWYTETSGGTQITADSVLTVAETKTVYAQWDMVPYTVSWNTGTGYTITVNRTSSPLKGASIGALNNGATIYYGDVLSVTYTASTGYSLGSKGSTSITVSGNVTSSTIYTSASLNSYTYKVVYVSSNGTDLGGTEVTYQYGTTNTISAPAKSGYTTPSSQSVKWDSTFAKTITFTYAPAAVSNSTITGAFTHYISYSITMNYRNRTANSVEVQIIATLTIQDDWNNYGYGTAFDASCNGVSTGKVQICGTSGLSFGGASCTGSSSWISIPLSTTDATTLSFSANLYETNHNGNYVSGFNYVYQSHTWTINIPAY